MSERCFLIVLALLSDKLFTGFIESSRDVSRESSWKLESAKADNHSYIEETDDGELTLDLQGTKGEGSSWDSRGLISLSEGYSSRMILPFGFEMIAILMGKAFLVAFISILLTAVMGLKTGKYLYDHSPISGDFNDPSRYPYSSYHDDHPSTTAATHYGFDPSSINSDYYSGYFGTGNPDPNPGQWLDLSSYPFANAQRRKQFHSYRNNGNVGYRSSSRGN